MEHVPNTFPSLFAGYAVIWTLLIVYVFRLGSRLSRLEKQTEE